MSRRKGRGRQELEVRVRARGELARVTEPRLVKVGTAVPLRCAVQLAG